MTALLNVALVIGICVIVGLFMAYATARGGSVIKTVFHLGEPDEWPRGVQEDDPTPWKLPRR